MHEASLHSQNCFVTLTYGRDMLPKNGSLEHRDFQLFMKRLRKLGALRPKGVVSEALRPDGNIRFYMCGEYGPKTLRPHYHACLFGVDFRSDRVPLGKSGSGFVYYESPTLSKLWPHGRASVQDLTRETAGYTARYIMKKALGESAESTYSRVDSDGVIVQVAPEYSRMSLRPGIGAGWFSAYSGDVFSGDFVVAEGRKRRTPRYYDKLLKRSGNVVADEIEFARLQAARVHAEDQTPERLRVREHVEIARGEFYRRDSA